MDEPRLIGTVVERDGAVGLYLRTDDGRLLALVADTMVVSIRPEFAHAQCRRDYEPFLGKRVQARGHDAGDTLWSAVVEPFGPRFETKVLPSTPDAIAPDGSDVRVLLRLAGGSMAQFELAAGVVSKAVMHRTVEEIWYVLDGLGEMWWKLDGHEDVVDLRPGVCLTIPQGLHFQFRATGDGPLRVVGVTMPPWPGQDEAVIVEGCWKPQVSR